MQAAQQKSIELIENFMKIDSLLIAAEGHQQ